MKVTFDNVYNAFQIIAPKGTMISFTGEPTALADGVYLVGDDGIINLDEQFLTDTLYLSTEGTDYAVTGGMRVTYPLGDETVIIRAGSSTIPFSKGGKGGGGSGDGTHYKGTTTTALTNGSTTNPITIDGESYTAVFGDIVVYGYTEFVFDGTQWSEFGRPFDTTPTSGSANAVTSDGIYQVTPSRRGTGTASVATGYATTASGNRSIVGGDTSKGTATNAVAIGNHCEASGQSSIALNYYTKATQSNSVVIGEVNDPKNGDLFEIGNGVDAQHRSNIVEVNKTSLNVNGEIKKNGVSLPTPYTTMPTITEAMLGQIAQYVGETTNDYVKGYFYIASSDGADEPTYSWVSMVDNTPINGSKNFVTSGAVYSRTPLMRGTGNRSAVGGYQTSATASNCISYGANTVASGAQSVAFGAGTQATNADQMSIGIYNRSRSGDLFNVGCGSGPNDRRNILEANYSSFNVNGNIQRDGVGIDDYTTTERKIGKWIDGSDLYQRTFEVTGLVNGQWNKSVLGTSGINIVDVQGWIDWTYNSEPNRRLELNYYFNSDDRCSLQNAYTDLDIYPYRAESGLEIDKAVITIKYTKPSAQANLMQTPTEEVSETPTTVEEDDMR